MPDRVDDSPPLDFALYGLSDSWQGSRWLSALEGKVGEPLWAAWLGHFSNAAAVFTGSAARARHDDLHTAPGADRLSQVAFTAAFAMSNFTLPGAPDQRPEPVLDAVVGEVEHAAANHARWENASWELDGELLAAKVWRFAGAWCAFSDALNDEYLFAYGIGVEPDDLEFSKVTDTQQYGFSRRQRLGPAALAEIKKPNLPRPTRLHEDHRKLVS
ncbi:hypothetical protein [Amycolatopsis magusensis]|uniref:Uncharacterized protein n=1 Tax=Amycolatopsis magusensis TaxID=882444 RepID=A0ABS4PIF8_9PSEU|nr:hypothetical protein [Amycolatopsis magusensis]MBP2179206.1 hypothetical protein [Amycolatopsis magusensis]MDI5981508.1 hypothetical protein [Amycolatopsis magusensis]